MQTGNMSLIRQLIPKSYHFDGYNEINCPAPRGQPFFTNGVIPIGKYWLTLKLSDENTLSMEFQSPCECGAITLEPFLLTLDNFISKLNQAVRDNSDFIYFDIKVRYGRRCTCHSRDCKELQTKHPSKVLAAVSFNSNEMKKALSAMYFSNLHNNTSKGGTTMKKNLFDINFNKFGVSKDPNIQSTMLGIAIKNLVSGKWYIYDQATNSLKDIAGMKLGNLPIYRLPTQTLQVGDLIDLNNDGRYSFVRSVNSADRTITVVEPSTGEIREKMPAQSIIPGMTLYTKLFAISPDSLKNMSGDNPMNNMLAAMCLMQWTKDDSSEFSLDSINSDSFNGIGELLPLMMMMNGGNIGDGSFTTENGGLNLPMLMMLGSGDGDNDQLMQVMILSQLTGNGNTNIFGNILGGVQSTVAPTAPATNDAVTCEKCGATYPEGTNFCPKCGGKTKKLATVCKKCGATLMDGAMFCHVCGAKTTDDTCPNCGRVIEGDLNFCPSCGTALKGQKVTTPKATTKRAPAKKPAAKKPAPSTLETPEA